VERYKCVLRDFYRTTDRRRDMSCSVIDEDVEEASCRCAHSTIDTHMLRETLPDGRYIDYLPNAAVSHTPAWLRALITRNISSSRSEHYHDYDSTVKSASPLRGAVVGLKKGEGTCQSSAIM